MVGVFTTGKVVRKSGGSRFNHYVLSRSLADYAFSPHLFVKLEKIILGILSICLRYFFSSVPRSENKLL